MADIEIWGPSVSHITTPAATDRIVAGTGPGAGGYSPRSDFIYRNGSGKYVHNGASPNYAINFADVNPTRGIIGDIANNGAAGLTGAQLSFTQNTIDNWVIGQPAAQGEFAIWAGRNIATNGTEIARWSRTGYGVGTSSPAVRLHVKSSGEIARLETTAPRGSGNNYMRFTDPTGTAGFLGWTGSSNNLDILNSLNANLVFGVNGGSQWQLTAAGNFEPIADNARNLAAASARISNSYFVNSPTVTCDIRLKFYRAEPAPTADEHAAALECFEVFGFFQHLDAIAREEDGGSPARWHFGPKAQAVWTIFASHGLAAPLGEDGLPPEGSVPPAFLCFDAWSEETAPVMAWWRPSDILGPDGEPIMVPCAEGEEGTEQRPTGETYVTREAGNIFGVRIDQLQSLMLVAIRKEMLALTDRVAALEAA